jgi:peptidoglycan/LPS O-acetylase OafA/YrhL
VPVLALIEATAGGEGSMTIEANTPTVVLLRAAYALLTWCLVLGVMGLFLKHFNGESRTMRYLADSAYWQYIMHLPLVVFLQWKLAPVALPGVVKLGVILAVTVSALLATYHFCVRRTFIGYVLNGPRVK